MEIINAHKLLVVQLEVDIEMDIEDLGCQYVEWIHLTQDAV
jgi:hypothetical protein